MATEDASSRDGTTLFNNTIYIRMFHDDLEVGLRTNLGMLLTCLGQDYRLTSLLQEMNAHVQWAL